MNLKFKTIIFLGFLATTSPLLAQWKPAGDKIKTTWGENLNPTNVLAEYPRPILERQDLNGLWN